MADTVINGNVYDWSDITIDVPGAEAAQFNEISYDFEHEAEQSMDEAVPSRIRDRQ